ncbi:DNA translocase FtsK [Salisediminibacterium halotolerans]|uniref:DNA segregation ATPase FtsK/SpoIIIE, S-DNA-T family n=1 Tax=Salisediminibacterium halotolerans TaxID=517425 RepID=A0A1H9V8L1_9BACI|nr:DNA translocase FtsK [Salisediminibacterium haloalkalitolerans]SES17744.1 DNA segregation ATPase FtsK/SpoIIIE, S-DNA-T family [Salisediminibacterium haloalkalitolerans]
MNFSEIPVWLKKVFRSFAAEEEQKNDRDHHSHTLNRYEDDNSEIEVKTISYYPKQGAFRFPVQVDEAKTIHEHIEETRTHTAIKTSGQTSSYTDKSTENAEPAKKNSPFVPTEQIPSPIYGYSTSRPARQQEETDTNETEKEADCSPLLAERAQKADPAGFNLKEQPEQLADEEAAEETLSAETESFHANRTSEQEPTAFEQEEKAEDPAVQPALTPVRHEDVQTVSAPEPAAKDTVSVKPFNVMMTPKDKQTVKKKNRTTGKSGYSLPPLHLLDVPARANEADGQWIADQTQRLNEAFAQFKIAARVVDSTRGPAVTQFEVQPDAGVKVNKIVNLADDLKLHLAAKDIRIEAPIPGKSTIGIEIPNASTDPVSVRKIMHSRAFTQAADPLTAAMGMDLTGDPVVLNLQEMPHGLVAGATGSGKSVCINSMLISLLYRSSPEEVRLLLIDPKMVELAPYREIPHLAAPVITDPKEATAALKWAVAEMENRYEKFMQVGVRDREKYNAEMDKRGEETEKMPYLLLVIDELADLMMTAANEVEEAICRIAQKARACGIHLLVATQRPSVDVITGLIKSNIPTRIAFAVSAQTDSRTILDCSGAEKLLGKGDMLMMVNGARRTRRVQGAFVSDEEIEKVTSFAAKQPRPDFLFEKPAIKEDNKGEDDDPLFDDVREFVRTSKAASASLLQRHFRIGYNRAARLVDDLEAKGIVSPARGSKPREVYLTSEANSEQNEY